MHHFSWKCGESVFVDTQKKSENNEEDKRGSVNINQERRWRKWASCDKQLTEQNREKVINWIMWITIIKKANLCMNNCMVKINSDS